VPKLPAGRPLQTTDKPVSRPLTGKNRKIKAVKVRDVIRLIEADGWKHVRTTGSHRHYKHESKPNVVTVPGHPGDDVPTGTLKSVLKAAGLEKR
jgi:predicted RNA binding protein YcfA (HicA-like mRNA interferase family)